MDIWCVFKQDRMSIDAIEGKTLRTQMTDNIMIDNDISSFMMMFVNELLNELVNELVNELINELIKELINELIKELINELTHPWTC